MRRGSCDVEAGDMMVHVHGRQAAAGRGRGLRCMLRSRSAGLILQVLLAGGTYRQALGVSMIGAMPAVAVRHERRKQEKRSKRPSQLYLGSYGLKQPSPPSRGSSPTPSPLQSPPSHHDEPLPEFYVCGKVSVLHMVVVSLLLGAILLIVGLVQLKPGADASDHRYYLIATGCFLMVLGLILTAVRCWVLPWKQRKQHRQQRIRKEDSQVAELAPPEQPLDVVLVNEGADTVTENSTDLPRVSVSSSGDGLQSTILTSPSEHDVLIKDSNSCSLEKTCPDTLEER